MWFGYRGPSLLQALMWNLLTAIALVLGFAFLVALIKAYLPWIILVAAAAGGMRWWLYRTNPW